EWVKDDPVGWAGCQQRNLAQILGIGGEVRLPRLGIFGEYVPDIRRLHASGVIPEEIETPFLELAGSTRDAFCVGVRRALLTSNDHPKIAQLAGLQSREHLVEREGCGSFFVQCERGGQLDLALVAHSRHTSRGNDRAV